MRNPLQTLVVVVGVLVLGATVTACSRTSPEEAGAVGTSGQADSSAIAVRVTSPFTTVELENHSGRPLIDISVAAKAGALEYTASIPRLEASEKRVLLPNEFRGTRDGAILNPSYVRPRQVLVAGTDLDGKHYQATAPWR